MQSYDLAIYHFHMSASLSPCLPKSQYTHCQMYRNSGDCMASEDVQVTCVNCVLYGTTQSFSAHATEMVLKKSFLQIAHLWNTLRKNMKSINSMLYNVILKGEIWMYNMPPCWKGATALLANNSPSSRGFLQKITSTIVWNTFLSSSTKVNTGRSRCEWAMHASTGTSVYGRDSKTGKLCTVSCRCKYLSCYWMKRTEPKLASRSGICWFNTDIQCCSSISVWCKK